MTAHQILMGRAQDEGGMKKRTKLIGQVGVDTGCIVITDPLMLRESPWKDDYSGIRPESRIAMGAPAFGEGEVGYANPMVLGTMVRAGGRAPGDGVYPVFGVYEGEVLVEVRVILDRENAELALGPGDRAVGEAGPN